ncbi:MAG: hypothetical protein JWS10_2437 [Cypionkella sp.]|nr:hypothetical protein [Cypionkella sp.]
MRELTIDPRCEPEVELLGGWRLLDLAWLPVSDALMRNPYGCKIVECDFFYQIRYIVSESIGKCPALVWSFSIDANKNITIEDIQKYDPY